MRIIAIAKIAMYVSGLFKITTKEYIVELNSVADPFRFVISMLTHAVSGHFEQLLHLQILHKWL